MAMPNMNMLGFSIEPEGRFAYSYNMAKDARDYTDFYGIGYTINASGDLSQIFTMPGAMIQADHFNFHPSGKFMYASGFSNGIGMITVYSIGIDGQLTLIQSLPDRMGALKISREGHFLFGNDYISSMGVYSIDQQTGMVTKIHAKNIGLATHDDHPIEVLSGHDANDPPIVHAGEDRWVPMQTAAVALHGHRSYDPDATRCSAVRANYIHQWSLVSKPAGSNLTNGSIINGNTLTSARFYADVPGDYTFRLSFTDDPGICNGTAKLVTDTVTIRVGYYHMQFANYNYAIGTPPLPQANYRMTQKRSNTKGVLRKYKDQLIFPDQLLCQSPEIFDYEMETNSCWVYQPCTGFFCIGDRYNTWSVTQRFTRFYGYWEWWDYQ
jgi:hypothetical protein